MRDSILAVAFVAATFGGIHYLKRTGVIQGWFPSGQSVSQPSNSFITAKEVKKGQGVKHDKKPGRYHDPEAEDHGQAEGASGDGPEAQDLTSIYHQKRSARPRATVGSEEKMGGGKTAKVIHGVPVQAWIASREDSLSLSAADAKDDGALRVYLQCLELKKKGPEYIGPKECDSLLATTRSKSEDRAPRL